MEPNNLSWQTIAALVAAAAAVLSAIIGPIATFLIARSQFRSTVVSVEEKERLDALQGDLSDFFANVMQTAAEMQAGHRQTSEVYAQRARALHSSHVKISFRLDPRKASHMDLDKALLDVVTATAERLLESDGSRDGLQNAYGHAYRLARSVITLERDYPRI